MKRWVGAMVCLNLSLVPFIERSPKQKEIVSAIVAAYGLWELFVSGQGNPLEVSSHADGALWHRRKVIHNHGGKQKPSLRNKRLIPHMAGDGRIPGKNWDTRRFSHRGLEK